jgi:hypothetical protein
MILDRITASLRNGITDHMEKYGLKIMRERATAQRVVAVYIDGLSGACALCVAGGQASPEEIEAQVIATFRQCLARDLAQMAKRKP